MHNLGFPKKKENVDNDLQVKLGDTTYKTEVFRKSLNPAWNSEWYRFELDDMELQVRGYLEVVIHRVWVMLHTFLGRTSSSANNGL